MSQQVLERPPTLEKPKSPQEIYRMLLEFYMTEYYEQMIKQMLGRTYHP